LFTEFRHARYTPRCQVAYASGFTLIELLVFIVVVGIGVTSILNVLSFTLSNSVDPIIRKQQVAIAESLLQEITSKPFTWCDTDDAKVTEASGYADCTIPQGIIPQANETRYVTLGTTQPFDNVGDYNGFSMSGIRDPSDINTTLPGLSNYSASVAISQVGSTFGLGDNTAALRIDVKVTAPSGDDLTLTGYRFRYAPNSP